MFGSIFYHLRRVVDTPTSSVTDARIAAESTMMTIENRVDHLELACSGLWTLLKQKHGYTDEALVAAIQEVDARDGNLDGKIGQVSKTCPHCQRKLLSRDSPKCSWCGGDLTHTPL